MTKRCLLLPTLVIALLSTATPAVAQQGLTITPPLQQINLTAEQSEQQVTISLTNHHDRPIELSLTSQDFGNLEEGGGLVFLGTEPNPQWDQHRLTPWLRVTPQTATIQPHQQLNIQATIINDQNLSPGGHYAAIIAKVSSSNQDQIAVNQSLSSLLFVNKEGGHIYSIETAAFTPQTNWWGTVKGAQLQLQNKGNTHLTPRGTVELKSPFNQTIAKGIINQQSSLLLPQQLQDYQTTFNTSSPAWWPGNYTLTLSYRYDGSDELFQQSQTTFSLGIVAIATLVIATSAGAALAIRHWAGKGKGGVDSGF